MPIQTESNSPRVIYPRADYKVSKYMDIIKFLSLIQEDSMYFCRLDKLEDKYEGISPSGNFEKRLSIYREIINYYNEKGATTQNINLTETVEKSFEYEKIIKKFNCICCWNKGSNESAALWKIYTHYGKGIMIRSSISKLHKAFAIAEEKIWISEIKYIDRANETIEEGNTIYPIIHKSNAYHYEDEVRLIHDVNFEGENSDYWEKSENQNGLKIKVNISELIEEIIISPFVEKWFSDIIAKLCEKYKMNVIIKPSAI